MIFSKMLIRIFVASLFCFSLGNIAIGEENLHIAIVLSRSAGPYTQAVEAIKKSFDDEKKSLHFFEYNLKGDSNNAVAIIEEIKKNNAELVFVVGTEAADSVSNLLTQIPIVAAMIYDAPVEPQENQYGVFLEVPFRDRFRIYKELGLSQARYALPYLKGKEKAFMNEATEAAAEASIQLIQIRMSSLKDFQRALKESHEKADYLLMVLDNDLYKRATSKELLLFSARNQLPLIAFSRNYVKSGALVSVSSNFKENGQQAAELGKNILAKAPIKEKFQASQVLEIAWNRNVARTFGIELSPNAKDLITHYY